MRGKGVRMIPFGSIDETSISNPRTDLGNIDELVDSFRRNGHLVPIVVRQEHFGGRAAPEVKLQKLIEPPAAKVKIFDIYYLVAGQRRLAAIKRLREEARVEQEKLGKRKAGAALPYDKVMAVVREGNAIDAKIDQIVENLHRKDMNPIETAEAVKELDNLGYAVASIADRIGRSEVWCRQLLALRAASIDLTKAVTRGLPLSVAFTIMKKPQEEQKALIETYQSTAAAPKAAGGGKRAAKRTVEAQAGQAVRMPFKALRVHLARLAPAEGKSNFDDAYLNGLRDGWNAVLGVSDIALVNLDKLLPVPAKEKEGK